MIETLVLTSVTKWEEPPRIRHQIAFAMKPYFKNILFVEMPNHLQYGFDSTIPSSLRQVDDNIHALRLDHSFSLPKNAQSLIPIVSELTQKKQLRKIAVALSNLRSTQSILINFNYTSYLFHESNLFSTSLFLLNDDFINKAPNQVIYRLAKRYQDNTARRADICLAVSTPLVEQLKKANPNTLLFLPGHSFTLESANEASTETGNTSADKNRIKVAFMGYISDRLELDWIIYAASQHNISFFLVGPNQLNTSETHTLENAGVHFLPPLTDQDLFKFLTSCDVLTVPYALRTDTISITAPNKLFQYIASGKPVVSSNLPHLLDLPPSVLVKARTKEDFVQKIIKAFECDSNEQRIERHRIAYENRWEKRGEELFKTIYSITSKSDSMHMQIL